MRGAWAPTALDLAKARVAARLSDDQGFLADSSHPESLAAIGGRRACMRSAAKEARWFQRAKLQVLEWCHGEGVGEDTWVVACAMKSSEPGQEKGAGAPSVTCVYEVYQKDGSGRWWFLSHVTSWTKLDQVLIRTPAFNAFFEKYYHQGPEGGCEDALFPYSFQLAAPRKSSQQLPWRFNLSPSEAAIYIDANLSEEQFRDADVEMMWSEEVAEDLRDPPMDPDTFMFRFGKYRTDDRPPQ